MLRKVVFVKINVKNPHNAKSKNDRSMASEKKGKIEVFRNKVMGLL